MRGFLGCDADYAAPCRGFDGDCGDLREQFASVTDSGIPDDYECTQFPVRSRRPPATARHRALRSVPWRWGGQDEKSGRDKAVVGLICFAVGLPFTVILEELFSVWRAATPPPPPHRRGAG